MLIIDKLDENQLSNQPIFDEINKEIDRYIEMDNISDAKDLLDELNDILGTIKSSELTDQYKIVVNKLKYICLSILPERKVAYLFENSLISGIELEIDIFGKLDVLFNLLRDRETGFETHRLLARNIGNNNEKLGNSKIKVSNENKLSNPTLANWIRDFSSTLTNNEIPSYLEEAEYINSNSNVKSLSVSEKESLKNILRLYNYLRFPVRKEDKVIETGHHVGKDELKLPNDDKPDKTYSGNPLEILKEKYNEYRRARWNILRLEDEILVATKGDIELIKKELASAARLSQQDRLIACTKILARQDSLAEALGNSPAWVNALGENIISKYTRTNEPSDISVVVSQLKDNVSAPAVISEFLQYLLIDKLGMSDSDSALVAIDIGQLLGENYQIMVFGNQENGSFEWTKNRIVNQELVIDFD
ncbi:MAG: hypothetical protein ACNFW9_06365 [Candidatus Kerfeldbacteria bacterium]